MKLMSSTQLLLFTACHEIFFCGLTAKKFALHFYYKALPPIPFSTNLPGNLPAKSSQALNYSLPLVGENYQGFPNTILIDRYIYSCLFSLIPTMYR